MSAQRLDLTQLKRQARELRQAHASGDRSAHARLKEHLPRLSDATPAQIRAHNLSLTQAQLVIARENGFASWPKLKARVETAATAIDIEAEARRVNPKRLRNFWLPEGHGDRPLTPAETLFADAAVGTGNNRWQGTSDVERMEALLRQEPSLLETIGPRVLAIATYCRGCAPAVQFLVDRGVPLDIDHDQYNVLHEAAWAARHEAHVENLRILFESGTADATDVSIDRPHDGWPDNISLLYWAAWGGSVTLAALLLQHGADQHLDLRFKNNGNGGHTALQVAAAPGPFDRDRERHAIARLLIAHGAYCDIFSASGLDDVERVKGLLAADMENVHATEESRSTPLHWAARKGAMKTARLLLQRGADVNALNRMKLSPLHMALDHPDMIWLLVEHGADLDAPDLKGRAPLHMATHGGQVDAAEALIVLGANIHAKNKKGKTPIEIARMDCTFLRK